MGGADPVELPKTAKEVEVTYWVLTDGTDRLGDKIAVGVYNRAGNLLLIKEPTFPKDTPVWTKYVHKVELPEGSSLLKISILIDSSKGAILFDDFSVKIDGKDVMYAGFEK